MTVVGPSSSSDVPDEEGEGEGEEDAGDDSEDEEEGGHHAGEPLLLWRHTTGGKRKSCVLQFYNTFYNLIVKCIRP